MAKAAGFADFLALAAVPARTSRVHLRLLFGPICDRKHSFDRDRRRDADLVDRRYLDAQTEHLAAGDQGRHGHAPLIISAALRWRSAPLLHPHIFMPE